MKIIAEEGNVVGVLLHRSQLVAIAALVGPTNNASLNEKIEKYRATTSGVNAPAYSPEDEGEREELCGTKTLGCSLYAPIHELFKHHAK